MPSSSGGSGRNFVRRLILRREYGGGDTPLAGDAVVQTIPLKPFIRGQAVNFYRLPSRRLEGFGVQLTFVVLSVGDVQTLPGPTFATVCPRARPVLGLQLSPVVLIVAQSPPHCQVLETLTQRDGHEHASRRDLRGPQVHEVVQWQAGVDVVDHCGANGCAGEARQPESAVVHHHTRVQNDLGWVEVVELFYFIAARVNPARLTGSGVDELTKPLTTHTDAVVMWQALFYRLASSRVGARDHSVDNVGRLQAAIQSVPEFQQHAIYLMGYPKWKEREIA